MRVLVVFEHVPLEQCAMHGVRVTMDLKMMIIFQVLLWAALVIRAQGQLQGPQQCVDESSVFQSIYHALPRFVPVPRVDPLIKRGFLMLFRMDASQQQWNANPSNDINPAPVPPESCQPSAISADVIAQINNLTAKDAFFYSFAPSSFNATGMLQGQFMNLSTPADVLREAGFLLRRRLVNPRVWYYALVGTLLVRPDLSGYYPAWAVDATPDLFLTTNVINDATRGSRRAAPPLNYTASCINSIGEPIEAAWIPVQQPQEQNMCQNQTQTGIITDQRRQVIVNQRQNQNQNRPQRLKRQQGNRPRPRRCIPYNGTLGVSGSDSENLLWYFREDVMLNSHHWYWHQYFPQSSTNPPDRRGEQFYFMHHNIIARYNAERLSNGIPMEVPLDLRLGGNIGVGYDSDIVDRTSGRYWTPRSTDTPLSDIAHLVDDDFRMNITIAEITRIYSMLTSHIRQGFLLANRSNQVFPLDIRNMEGLSHLGNTVEGVEELSTHAQFYHTYGVHNLWHVAVALATDSDFRCGLPTGVTADLTVTMRDPAFYKIHSLVDQMFHMYKSSLPTYHLTMGEWPLHWDGVRLQSLDVLSGPRQFQNFLTTFWSIKRFPLAQGIDGSIHDGDVDVDICHHHLNHEPFMFRLTIDVDSCARTLSRGRGTVRIFMAPRYNLDGRRFSMDETRRLMFQLDVFPVELRRGRNTITRLSQDSSLTRPWSRSLRDMLRDPDNGGRTEYCGCGWPRHLFIPKGSPQGMEFDLFAMVTNFDQDQVLDTIQAANTSEPCNSPYIFCGVPFKRHPDARPMGYPFDMEPYQMVDEESGRVRPVRDLDEYTAPVGNMKSTVVIVGHVNTFLG